MKNIFLIVVFGLFVNRLCAQIPAAAYNEYRLYEQLAAEKRLTFVPNPNTYNYDVTYQKLEIQIDPSQYYIYVLPAGTSDRIRRDSNGYYHHRCMSC